MILEKAKKIKMSINQTKDQKLKQNKTKKNKKKMYYTILKSFTNHEVWLLNFVKNIPCGYLRLKLNQLMEEGLMGF